MVVDVKPVWTLHFLKFYYAVLVSGKFLMLSSGLLHYLLKGYFVLFLEGWGGLRHCMKMIVGVP